MVPSALMAFSAAPHAGAGLFMHPAPRCRAAPARTAPGMQMQGGEGYEASQKLGRRGFMAALLTAAVAGSSVIGAPGGASAEDAGAKAFELVPTKDERWALGGFTENGETELLSGLASCDVVFLGEHHNQVQSPSQLASSPPSVWAPTPPSWQVLWPRRFLAAMTPGVAGLCEREAVTEEFCLGRGRDVWTLWLDLWLRRFSAALPPGDGSLYEVHMR